MKKKWFQGPGKTRPIVNKKPTPPAKKKDDPLSILQGRLNPPGLLNLPLPSTPKEDELWGVELDVSGVDSLKVVGEYVDSEEMMLGILYTEGELDHAALEEECYKERWVPLMGLKDTQDESLTLLCFKNANLGIDFIKTNLPEGWIPGLIQLPWQEIDHTKEMGWKVEVVTQDRRLADDPRYEVVSLIYTFVESPTYHPTYKKRQGGVK